MQPRRHVTKAPDPVAHHARRSRIEVSHDTHREERTTRMTDLKQSHDPNDYPDLEFDAGLDSKVKTLKRLPGTTVAPRIKWGEHYKALPIHERLRRAERMADGMNHAADVAQTQWFDMLKLLKKQAAQIEGAQPRIDSIQQAMNLQLARQNEQVGELEQTIKALQAERRDLQQRVKELEDGPQRRLEH